MPLATTKNKYLPERNYLRSPVLDARGKQENLEKICNGLETKSTYSTRTGDQARTQWCKMLGKKHYTTSSTYNFFFKNTITKHYGSLFVVVAIGLSTEIVVSCTHCVKHFSSFSNPKQARFFNTF